MFRNNTCNTERKSSKLSLVIGVLAITALFFYLLVGGFMKIFNKSDYEEINIDKAGYGIVIEHSINGLIPTGKDYYYIGLNSEEGDIYVIQAGKKWFEDNFYSSDNSSNEGSMTLKTKVNRLDYEVARELASVFSDSDVNISCDYCYDTLYKSKGILMIISAVLILATIIYFIMIKFQKIQSGKLSGLIGLLLLMAVGITILKVIR